MKKIIFLAFFVLLILPGCGKEDRTIKREFEINLNIASEIIPDITSSYGTGSYDATTKVYSLKIDNIKTVNVCLSKAGYQTVNVKIPSSEMVGETLTKDVAFGSKLTTEVVISVGSTEEINTIKINGTEYTKDEKGRYYFTIPSRDSGFVMTISKEGYTDIVKEFTHEEVLIGTLNYNNILVGSNEVVVKIPSTLIRYYNYSICSVSDPSKKYELSSVGDVSYVIVEKNNPIYVNINGSYYYIPCDKSEEISDRYSTSRTVYFETKNYTPLNEGIGDYLFDGDLNDIYIQENNYSSSGSTQYFGTLELGEELFACVDEKIYAINLDELETNTDFVYGTSYIIDFNSFNEDDALTMSVEIYDKYQEAYLDFSYTNTFGELVNSVDKKMTFTNKPQIYSFYKLGDVNNSFNYEEKRISITGNVMNITLVPQISVSFSIDIIGVKGETVTGSNIVGGKITYNEYAYTEDGYTLFSQLVQINNKLVSVSYPIFFEAGSITYDSVNKTYAFVTTQKIYVPTPLADFDAEVETTGAKTCTVTVPSEATIKSFYISDGYCEVDLEQPNVLKIIFYNDCNFSAQYSILDGENENWGYYDVYSYNIESGSNIIVSQENLH